MTAYPVTFAYPPFSFDTGPSEPSTTTASPAYPEPTTLI
jgi:hypothetical protein